MTKKLGWIAAAGFAVGFTALLLAFATGGSEALEWARLHNLHGGDFWKMRCDDKVAVDESATERRWAWNGSDTVYIALPANVHYRGGEGDEVVIHGDARTLAHIDVQGGRIGTNCTGSGMAENVDVTLPGRVFRQLVLAGSGRISLENLNQPELEMTIAGSGTILAQGKAEHVKLTIAGSGDARLAELVMKEFEVNVAGSGDAEAGPTDSAKVTMAGSGNLRLLSHPARLETNIMGSGRITHAPRANES